ncbi:MAG TPA: DUF1674 domain-containing protein [Alphaproteobacteria bacterium]|nr:DUF1674 domain-containing protein [Alphaproteobacteria bacterium]
MKQDGLEPAAKEQRTNGQPGEPPIGGKKIPEAGGPAGPEPTRYGDWERGGRCVDF